MIWVPRTTLMMKKTRYNSANAAVRRFAQKNRHQRKKIMISPIPAKGPYCLSMSSQLILTAALRYFLLSSRNLLLMSPIFSRLSPRYNRSSMFLVMTFVTSLSSSFSLSRLAVALVSIYVFFVRWMNVSNSTNAYGRSVVECTCCRG